MGRKRRLNSAKAKFNAKHALHPRARLLATQRETTEDPPIVVESTPEVIPEPTPEVPLTAKTPAATTITPPTPIKAKTAKAPRKKTATSRRKTTKRATKKKTTSTTA